MIPILPSDHPGILEAAKTLYQGIRQGYGCTTQEAHQRARVVSQTAIINFLAKANPEDIKTYSPRLYDQIRKEIEENND